MGEWLPGKTYVVAVSGGVDSVVLLDVLASQTPAQLTVAHFDHGIRDDSREDRVFVQGLAQKYRLQLVYDEGRLGASASEEAARTARYKFLRRVKEVSGADAIATAHHQDDVLETAILNLLRGTGRKGLSSLKSSQEVYRPLLGVPKANLITYARRHGLTWREDSTNQDTNYLRNYVRLRLLARFDAAARRRLCTLVDSARLTNDELDELLAVQLATQPARDRLDRKWFIMLPHNVAREVVAAWLRASGIGDFDKKTIERIVANAKTLSPGRRIDVQGKHIILVTPDALALTRDER